MIIVPAVLVLGSGLAALPEANQGSCVDYEVQLFPYGSKCQLPEEGPPVYRTDAPGAGELLAWFVLAALLLGGAVARRRSAWARGVAVAVAVLGVFGLLSHQVELFGAALATVMFLGPPLAFAVDALLRGEARWKLAPVALAALSPLAVIVAWTPPGFLDAPVVGLLAGVLAAALLAAATARVASKLA